MANKSSKIVLKHSSKLDPKTVGVILEVTNAFLFNLILCQGDIAIHLTLTFHQYPSRSQIVQQYT